MFEHTKANGAGVIGIRTLAGGALSGSAAREPNASPPPEPIGSANELRRRPCARAPLPADDRGRICRRASPSSPRASSISTPAMGTALMGLATLDQLEQAIAAVEKGPLPLASADAASRRRSSGSIRRRGALASDSTHAHGRGSRQRARRARPERTADRADRRERLLHPAHRWRDHQHLAAADGGLVCRAAGGHQHRHHRLSAVDGGVRAARRLDRRPFWRKTRLCQRDRDLRRRLDRLWPLANALAVRGRADRAGRGRSADGAGRPHRRAAQHREILADRCDRADGLAGADRAGDRPPDRRPDHHLCRLAGELPDQHPARRHRARPRAAVHPEPQGKRAHAVRRPGLSALGGCADAAALWSRAAVARRPGPAAGHKPDRCGPCAGRAQRHSFSAAQNAAARPDDVQDADVSRRDARCRHSPFALPSTPRRSCFP